MDNTKAVVSLGHEALGVTTNEQMNATRNAARALADLIEAGYQLIITHSNGPQVSMIHKAMTELHRIYIDYTPAPMCVCNAMSQGYVGYDIQNSLATELSSRGISTPVSTILTQVTVDPYDEAFYAPTKAIGRNMSREDADIEIKKGNFVREEPGNGYRRIIAAPKPIDIVEIDAIRALVDAGQEVICCGGGGIPVVSQGKHLAGVPAVIDKDLSASLLAQSMEADMLLILTAVEKVAIRFGKPDQKGLDIITVAEANKYIADGEFAPGSMLPKVQAGIKFAESGKGRTALITHLQKAREALQGTTGTRIVKEV